MQTPKPLQNKKNLTDILKTSLFEKVTEQLIVLEKEPLTTCSWELISLHLYLISRKAL